MSSAQHDLLPWDETPTGTLPESAIEAAAGLALKEQVSERLAAHRARRQQPPAGVIPIARTAPVKARSAQIAAAVAERYAHSQSYRAFLAAEAEKAIREAEAASREAEAAAEIAARSAKAVADAQYELLAELEHWTLTPPPEPELQPKDAASDSLEVTQAPPQSGPGFTVRLADEVVRAAPPASFSHMHSQDLDDGIEDIQETLDDEIAFRRAPVFDDFGISAVDIPANLIEFPRQLVAARRARPRLAEGPLREDAAQPHDPAQLRIFEVEAAHISAAPATESLAPEWSSILLAAHPVSEPVVSAEAPFTPVFAPQTAPLTVRLMAGIVDTCIVTATFLVFAAAFALSAAKFSARLYPGQTFPAPSHPAALQIAALGTVVTLGILAMLYQLLFFTFSEATPGMRYARIALCTFSDDNPSRSAMRRRVFAVLLAACPLGLGFLWAWLDEEGLGWHDRISRMYQRSY
ncbi:MAG: RDD family protein [Acidobacteriota bacterium]|nr:RDD family protein [Acidobacteriota bacterium]